MVERGSSATIAVVSSFTPLLSPKDTVRTMGMYTINYVPEPPRPTREQLLKAADRRRRGLDPTPPTPPPTPPPTMKPGGPDCRIHKPAKFTKTGVCFWCQIRLVKSSVDVKAKWVEANQALLKDDPTLSRTERTRRIQADPVLNAIGASHSGIYRLLS